MGAKSFGPNPPFHGHFRCRSFHSMHEPIFLGNFDIASINGFKFDTTTSKTSDRKCHAGAKCGANVVMHVQCPQERWEQGIRQKALGHRRQMWMPSRMWLITMSWEMRWWGVSQGLASSAAISGLAIFVIFRLFLGSRWTRQQTAAPKYISMIMVSALDMRFQLGEMRSSSKPWEGYLRLDRGKRDYRAIQNRANIKGIKISLADCKGRRPMSSAWSWCQKWKRNVISRSSYSAM